MRFIPNTTEVCEDMLREMNMPSMESLFAGIPDAALTKRPLDIPEGMAESDQLAYFSQLASQNIGADFQSFLGAGSYPHFIPLVSDTLVQRSEFFTAYTPYQPEVSQGTLQSVFEFQTFMTLLTGMEVSNASMYDGASSAAEAILMATRLTKNRPQALLAESLHPHYQNVCGTYVSELGIDLNTVPLEKTSGQIDQPALASLMSEQTSCVVVQQPNFYGVIEDLTPLAQIAHQKGALLVVVINEPHCLSVLRTPGQCGADIVVGEAQGFGVPIAYGGPYLGFMTTKDKYKRQMPGRLAGRSQDVDGNSGFVLTLSTREQHIRREKATSNVCTNQNLVMLSSLIYLTLMGRKGLRQVAQQNVSLLQYFLQRLSELKEYKKAFSGNSFNEVTIRCSRPAAEVIRMAAKQQVIPGLDLGQLDPYCADQLLINCTETKRKADIDQLIAVLKEAA